MFLQGCHEWDNYVIAAPITALNNLDLCIPRFLLGYPSEKDGERPSGAADSDWCPLWAEEERGRGADWTQRQDCNAFPVLVSHLLFWQTMHWLFRITVIKERPSWQKKKNYLNVSYMPYQHFHNRCQREVAEPRLWQQNQIFKAKTWSFPHPNSVFCF